MDKQERYQALRAWMNDRSIGGKDVAEQLGFSTKTASHYALEILKESTMGKQYRDHLIALGFPVDLLPEQGSQRSHLCGPPQWPNPEAAKTPLKRG